MKISWKIISIISLLLQESFALKVLVCITAYRSIDNSYLLEGLTRSKDLCEGGYDVDVVVHTVDNWQPNQRESLQQHLHCTRSNSPIPLEFEVFDSSVKLKLTEKHRSTISRNLHNYDLFIYQEDDMAVTVDHVDLFVAGTAAIERTLSTPPPSPILLSADNTEPTPIPAPVPAPEQPTPIIGFVRYEEVSEATSYINGDINIHYPTGGRFLIENPIGLPHFKLRCIGDTPYLSDVLNPHAALWMLTRQQIVELQASCAFLDQGEIELKEERGKMVYMSTFSLYQAPPQVLQGVGIQEGISCGVEKVIPAEGFCRFAVHHSRQRYAAATPIITVHDAWHDAVEYVREALLQQHQTHTQDIPQCWLTAVATGRLDSCS